LEENDIIDLLKKGDESAFLQFVKAFQDRVYNTALGFLRNEENAEDITQEVFMEVYLSIGRFEGRSKLSTWVYRIAVTKSLEFIRKQKRKKRFAPVLRIFDPAYKEPLDIPDLNHPGFTLENKELGEQIFRALDALPENQKVAFTLHKLEGLPYQEIASIMNTSLSAVESLIHRARASLRRKLDHPDNN